MVGDDEKILLFTNSCWKTLSWGLFMVYKKIIFIQFSKKFLLKKTGVHMPTPPPPKTPGSCGCYGTGKYNIKNWCKLIQVVLENGVKNTIKATNIGLPIHVLGQYKNTSMLNFLESLLHNNYFYPISGTDPSTWKKIGSTIQRINR